MTEKDRIVAWLRRMQDYRHAQKLDAQTPELAIMHGGMMQAYENAAKAIERGEHLIRPGPTIPASEWKNSPSVGH